MLKNWNNSLCSPISKLHLLNGCETNLIVEATSQQNKSLIERLNWLLLLGYFFLFQFIHSIFKLFFLLSYHACHTIMGFEKEEKKTSKIINNNELYVIHSIYSFLYFYIFSHL